jgi:hypothetical protein
MLQQLRKLSNVGGDAAGLVAGEQVRDRAPSRFLLEIDIGERMAVGVMDDEALSPELGVGSFDGPRRREAALTLGSGAPASCDRLGGIQRKKLFRSKGTPHSRGNCNTDREGKRSRVTTPA